ncbi:MAG: hypothetical protein WCV50_01175 [Patescibacteria group bacterium]
MLNHLAAQVKQKPLLALLTCMIAIVTLFDCYFIMLGTNKQEGYIPFFIPAVLIIITGVTCFPIMRGQK